MNVKTHVPKRPEFLELTSSKRLSAISDRQRLARKISDFISDHVAQRGISPIVLGTGPMLDYVPFGQIVDCDNRFRHGSVYRSSLDEVGEALFHVTKSMYAEPQKKRGDADTRRQPWQIDWALSI